MPPSRSTKEYNFKKWLEDIGYTVREYSIDFGIRQPTLYERRRGRLAIPVERAVLFEALRIINEQGVDVKKILLELCQDPLFKAPPLPRDVRDRVKRRKNPIRRKSPVRKKDQSPAEK